MNLFAMLLFAQKNRPPIDEGGLGMLLAGLGACVYIPLFIIAAVVIVSRWKIFTKAGKPGWASIVPIYSTWVFVEILQKPPLWFWLMIFPCTMPIFAILGMIQLAKVFGKETGFAIGLILLPLVFLPILAFGSAKYVGDPDAPGVRSSRRSRDEDDEEEDEAPPRRRR